MEKTLDFLQNDGCLYKENRVYDAAPKPFAYDCAHYEALTAIRRREMEQNDGCLYKENRVYDASPKPFAYDRAYYEAVTAIRRREMEQMKGLERTPGCDAQYIIRALDDPAAAPCGHCASCLDRADFSGDRLLRGPAGCRGIRGWHGADP